MVRRIFKDLSGNIGYLTHHRDGKVSYTIRDRYGKKVAGEKCATERWALVMLGRWSNCWEEQKKKEEKDLEK